MMLTCTNQDHRGVVVIFDGDLHAACPLCYNVRKNVDLEGLSDRLIETAHFIDVITGNGTKKAPSPTRRKKR